MNERGSWLLKTLDRIAGIPLVMVLGLLRARNVVVPPAIESIGLLKTAAIGDVVLLSAVVQDLREAFPAAVITLILGSNNAEAGNLSVGVDRVIALPVKRPLRAVREVRRSGRYDVWIDFGQWPRLDAILSSLAKARVKIGFRTPGQFRHFAYDVRVDHSNQKHELDNYRGLIEPLGIRGHHRPEIRVDSETADTKRVVVHMFAGGTKPHLKEWPEPFWRDVIGWLVNNGYEVFLTGAMPDRERAESLRRRIGLNFPVRNAAGQYSLGDLARLLKSSALLITVNTGIMHLGAAVGCPLIALNGPTSSKRWGPLSERAVSIQSPLHCSPCLNLGFDYGCPVNDCMKAIPAQQVMEQARRILAVNGPFPFHGGSAKGENA
jgi:ADP-heptose:LPS heptosyltransferase